MAGDRNTCPECGTKTMIRVAQQYEQCVMCRFLHVVDVDRKFPFNRYLDHEAAKVKSPREQRADGLLGGLTAGDMTFTQAPAGQPMPANRIDRAAFEAQMQHYDRLIRQQPTRIAELQGVNPAPPTIGGQPMPVAAQEEFQRRAMRHPGAPVDRPEPEDLEPDDYNWRDERDVEEE